MAIIPTFFISDDFECGLIILNVFKVDSYNVTQKCDHRPLCVVILRFATVSACISRPYFFKLGE